MACVLWAVGLLFLKMYKNKWAKLLLLLRWSDLPALFPSQSQEAETKDARANFSHFMGNVFSCFFFFFCRSERDFGFDNFYFPTYTRVCLHIYIRASIYTLHIYGWKYIMRIIVVASSPSFRSLFPFCTFASSFCWINYRQLALLPFAPQIQKKKSRKKEIP